MRRRAILILGMHRSGTSALTRALNLAGMRLATDLSNPNEFNDKGYWESQEIQKINDSLLVETNSAWFDSFSWSKDLLSTDEYEVHINEIVEFLEREFTTDNSFIFGIKDPRICRLAPVWKTALNRFKADVSVVIPFRNPLSVAESLNNRDGLQIQAALFLWLRHVLDAEYHSRDCDRVFVPYENLMDNWQEELTRIKDGLELDLLPQTPSLVQSIERFLTKSSQHYSFSDKELQKFEGSRGLVFRVYKSLNAAITSDNKHTRNRFDKLRDELTSYEQDSGSLIQAHIRKFLAPKTHQISSVEKITEARAERFALRESLLIHVHNRKHLESDLLNKKRHIDRLKLTIEQKKKDIKKAGKDILLLEQISENHENRISKLTSELGVKIDEANKLGFDLELKEAEVDKLGSELELERKEVDELNSELKQERLEKDKLNSELKQERFEIDKLNSELKLEKSIVEKLTSKLSKKRATVRSLLKKVESLSLLHNSQKESNIRLSERIQESNSESMHARDQYWQLRETFANSLEEKSELENAGETLKTQLSKSVLEVQTLQHKLNVMSANQIRLGMLAKKFRQRFRQLLLLNVFGSRVRQKIIKSGIYDEEWYLRHNRDLKNVKHPLKHYLIFGAFEKRNPGTYFDSHWYIENNPDVANSGANPLVHYLTWGWKEYRDPNPYFSTRWYLDSNPKLIEQGINPLSHFATSGDKDGLAPSPKFDSQWYLTNYGDVARYKMPPFYHFINYGEEEGRLAVPSLDVAVPQAKFIQDIKVKFFSGRNVFRRKASVNSASDDRANILLVTHTSGFKIFGAERSFLDVCGGLDPAQYNVFAVVPTYNKRYIEALSSITDGVYQFDYRWWRKGVDINPNAIGVFGTLLRKHRIDLMYGNTIMLREPFLAAKEQGILSVLHAREIIAKDEHLRVVIGKETDQILSEVQNRADLIIANSRATALSFENSDQVRLLYNTINGNDFTCLENSPGSKIYVGIISSNIAKKGLRDFIGLASLAREVLPDVVFRVIGPDTEFSRELQDNIEKDGSQVNLEFCGYFETAKEAIEQVHIVVNFSSFAESFGRTIAEAMMAGRPAIVYDHGALPELVEHNKTGFVIPFKNYEAAIPHLIEMASQPELIAELGEAGQKRALELFDLPVFRSQLQNIMEGAIQSRKQDSLPTKAIEKQAKRKMKVAYFLWHFPVPSETFVLNELRYLVELGHDVLVYCRQSPHKDFAPDFEITWKQVATTDELAEELVRTKRTLVHSHFVYPTVTEFLWPACEKANIEFTFIAHAQDIFRYENDKRNRVGEVAKSRLCKRVLVPGRFHRDYLLKRGVPDNKIFINPQGIDPNLYPFHGGELKLETRKISCIQRFVEKKGILNLIRTAPFLANHGISIEIYGYGALEESYSSEIRSLGVDNVTLCGSITSRDDLIKVIATSDLFVTPCIRASDGDMDGIPTVFMEAMSLGTPVVSTGVSSIPDLIADGINGLICEEENPESLAETIIRYYEMEESRKYAMRLAARNVIESNFNTEKLLGRLIDIYQQRTIDIVIVSWNNLPELKEVIARILKFTGMAFRLIITDNKSEKPVVEYLHQLQDETEQVTVLWQDQNLFVGPGTNKALEEGNSEYIVYVCGKEGFALRHNWERELVEYMDAHTQVGLAGTLGYSPSYLTGGTYDSIPVFSDFRNTEFALNNPEREFRHVQGGLFVIRRKMYEEIGGFSDEVPHNYTDVEYSFYVESCGWQLGQIPGVLALYNKSRPGIYSRLTEDIRVIHPPVLDEVSKVERIANGLGALCGLCEWYGEEFVEQDNHWVCPGCGSLPAHRSVWRFLAESTLTYRRLTGLYVNSQTPLVDLWEKQFQGSTLGREQLGEIKSTNKTLDFSSNRLDVIYLDDVLELDDDWLLKESYRVLSEGGVLIVRQPFGRDVSRDFQTIDDVKRYLRQYGFCNLCETSYTSKVVQYDWLPLLVCEK